MNLIPTTSLFVGDLWAWTEALPEFPASTYSLRYIFRNALIPSSPLIVDSFADFSAHVISVPSTSTSALVAGDYMVYVQAVTLATGDVQTLCQGKVTLSPNPTDVSAAPADARSKWVIAVEKLEAAIAGDNTAGVLEYSIGGRTLKRMPTKDRLEALAYCKRQLAKEQGYPFGRHIKFTFAD